jgi:hypothetical protein
MTEAEELLANANEFRAIVTDLSGIAQRHDVPAVLVYDLLELTDRLERWNVRADELIADQLERIQEARE